MRFHEEVVIWSDPSVSGIYLPPPLNTILCPIPRMTVTSLSVPKDTRCRTHHLCVNPGVPFWTREKKHKLRARWQVSSSGIRADVTVILDLRHSLVIRLPISNKVDDAIHYIIKTPIKKKAIISLSVSNTCHIIHLSGTWVLPNSGVISNGWARLVYHHGWIVTSDTS